ncbi:MAG: hypothetical protein ACI8TA_002462 [Cyclobacteriaceae bacterium]|jgi:hypothetical protein
MEEMMEKNIIKALKSAPDFQLNDQFAQRVLIKIRQKELATARWNVLILMFSILTFVGLSIAGLIYFIGFDSVYQLLYIAKWVLPISAAVILVQWLDRQLIWKRRMRGV